MKSMKCRIIAILMVTVMVLSQVSISVSAATVNNKTGTKEKNTSTVSGTEITSDYMVEESHKGDIVSVNTGMGVYDVCENPEEGEEGFEADGSYTIQIPEKNPFFPYEVQFIHNGVITTKWFMTPDSTIVIGRHVFKVDADFDGSEITQMSLNVAGQEVVIYPERKNFSDNVLEEESLLPLKEQNLQPVNLSMFTPVELTNVSMISVFSGQVVISDASIMTWKKHSVDEDEYTVSMPGDHINLSYGANSQTTYWTIIVGNDQLNSNNIKYNVPIVHENSREWLVPTVYAQDAAGNRTGVNIDSYYYNVVRSGYGYNSTQGTESIEVSSDTFSENTDIYYGFNINEAVLADRQYDHIKIYEGFYNSALDAISGTDITEKVLGVDMSRKDAGYKYQYPDSGLTIVTFDAAGSPTGCQPVKTQIYRSSNGTSYVSCGGLYTASGRMVYGSSGDSEDDYYVYKLYKDNPANGTYYLKMDYYQNGSSLENPLSKITAAYVGTYSSIAEAQAAGAQDIKTDLFGKTGYPSDYSQGIRFTVFTGEEIYYYAIRTEEGYKSAATGIYFTGLRDRNGKRIETYIVPYNEDSYGESNYRALLVKPDADVTYLAPEFYAGSEEINLYASGSKNPEVSGKSYHDFSGGPIQYTASAENGINAANIWLSVIKAVNGRGQLYISSTADKDAETRIENGIIYSKREIFLNSLSSYHDIFVMNTGTEAFPAMSVELESDVLRLDEYWDFKGQYELAGVDIDNLGETENKNNIAKLRLRVKDGVNSGTEISGTLTIKSNGITLAVLTLTGMAGNPQITTTDIPAAVKYVPYGTMIQNSNKYSNNIITYEMTYGTLPEGMELRPNGELYGVSKETGEFEIGVRITGSINGFTSDSSYFTLIVNDNTDPNVDGATDEGYTVLQRIPNLTMDDPNSYTFVSEGVYGEYKAVYLDGEKLVEGVDYTSESGSTRITLRSQTLTSSNTEGAHTIGVEFRSSSDDSLKRAAQNYRIIPGSINDRVGGGAAGSSSSMNMAPIRYTVKSGDTLWKIARQFYGNGAMWTKIYADNKSTIKNPNRIYVGQVLLIYPSIGDGTYITESGAKTYRVKRGDTLWSIAEEMYGKGKRWKKIYEANKGTLSNPNKLYAGQILIIPN